MGYDAARNYRLQAAEFASPVGVIVQAYEQIIRALQEAARAADRGKFEHKTNETNRALAIVSHLEAMLDHEVGPNVANKLEVFYETMRYQIVKASAERTGERLREVSDYFVPLRDAWRVVEKEHPTPPGAPAPPRRPTPPLTPIDFPADQVLSNWSA